MDSGTADGLPRASHSKLRVRSIKSATLGKKQARVPLPFFPNLIVSYVLREISWKIYTRSINFPGRRKTDESSSREYLCRFRKRGW